MQKYLQIKFKNENSFNDIFKMNFIQNYLFNSYIYKFVIILLNIHTFNSI